MRLFQPAVMTGFRRNQANQYNDHAILHIDNVASKDDARWYLGKRVAYIYRGLKKRKCFRSRAAPQKRTKTRVIWGKVAKTHGNSGAVRCFFSPNLPSQAIGKKCRVFMFPSRI
mmetsp:Transcript_11260/g.17035  ORF Transcript_11260/g.17035 Transcript_11260/m.17035 type:complete len:114 (-) Transcript_11260:42-383(-)